MHQPESALDEELLQIPMVHQQGLVDDVDEVVIAGCRNEIYRWLALALKRTNRRSCGIHLIHFQPRSFEYSLLHGHHAPSAVDEPATHITILKIEIMTQLLLVKRNMIAVFHLVRIYRLFDHMNHYYHPSLV